MIYNNKNNGGKNETNQSKINYIFTLIALLFTVTACKKRLHTYLKPMEVLLLMICNHQIVLQLHLLRKRRDINWLDGYDYADLTGDVIAFPYKENNATLYGK